ncbi:DUF1631 family protein [Amphibiibacter pelophylacis]|uniref:DUF1631 family protein n=1 Tax=Amphibiibacter pelophylacis TaxID=1799477 RepID=A0ACC6P0G1_9BURK
MSQNNLPDRCRRFFVREWQSGLLDSIVIIQKAALTLLDKPKEPGLQQRLRDVIHEVERHIGGWPKACTEVMSAVAQTRRNSGEFDMDALTLVDNDTIEGEILVSRLSMAMVEKANWEINDLHIRVRSLLPGNEIPEDDLLQPPKLAGLLFKAWRKVGLSMEAWRSLQTVIQTELATLAEECYHEANAYLVDLGVMPSIDVRQLNKRQRSYAAQHGSADESKGEGGLFKRWVKSGEQSQAMLGKLNSLLGKHLPGLLSRQNDTGEVRTSDQLNVAMNAELQQLKQRFGELEASAQQDSGQLLKDLQQRKAVLKQSAANEEERATIEIVALLFQSILTEDRLPAAMRVWFARLQIPVLRLAVTEPKFFASGEHPARRLIDRMGSCVMGFDSIEPSILLGKVEEEIKRTVEFIEAYPDSGQKAFITALHDFESFLTQFFSHGDERTRKSVSVVQQIEQRETLAVQFTIELRKMLSDVPVHEDVRNFLFTVWAEVLASSTVKYSLQSDEVKKYKRIASELIWAASAKVTREERAQLIKRLPLILKGIKEGMASVGMPAPEQTEWLRHLNTTLAQAFTAKVSDMPTERLHDLMRKLDALEQELPDVEDFEIDDSFVFELSGGELENVTVISHGGTEPPSVSSLAIVNRLQLGTWFGLRYGESEDNVQLSWQGMNKLLSLFTTLDGRSYLIQKQRAAGYIEAELLVPRHTETITEKATRQVLAKLEADPERLHD